MPRRPRFNASAAVALLLCASVFTSLAAHAQKPAETPRSAELLSMVATPTSISGRTVERKSFTLASLKGKVVLVMFWSTDCAICLDKMPELRENVQGWADKPFEVVLVSVDRRMADVDRYNAIVNKSVPLKQRFTQLWTGDAAYQDNLGTANLTRAQLPATLLIDKQGKLVERFSGRIPAEVWDKISDLL
jgi:thiol-disulfide isomerase/thioredoxin